MKQTFCHFLSSLSLVSLLSCQKEPDSFTSFSGTVVEQGTNKPVPNAEVNMYWLERYTFNIIENKIATDSTDANGKFVVEADAPDEDLLVYAQPRSNYFRPDFLQDLRKANISQGEHKSGTLTLIPHAWIRLNFFNTEGNDNIQTSSIPGGGQVIFASGNISKIALAKGNQEVEFSVFIDKAGVQQRIDRYTVTTIGHDTVDVRIDF